MYRYVICSISQILGAFFLVLAPLPQARPGGEPCTYTCHLIYYLRPSVLSPTQIRGHICMTAGSSPPSPLRLVPFTFISTKLPPFLPSSIRVQLYVHT